MRLAFAGIVMRLYVRCGNAFACHAEFSKDLGMFPLWEINICKGETIFDIPFGQIIYTPRKQLMRETGLPLDDKGHKQGNLQISDAASRATEN